MDILGCDERLAQIDCGDLQQHGHRNQEDSLGVILASVELLVLFRLVESL